MKLAYTAKSEVRYVHKLSAKWPKFSTFDCNEYLDCDTKAAVMNASSSVVALISFSGIKLNFLLSLYLISLFVLINFVLQMAFN